MSSQPFKEVCDVDERRWRIEEAARALQQVAHISQDPDLLKEAQKEVDRLAEEAQIAADAAAAMTAKAEKGFVESVNKLSQNLYE